MTEEEQWQQYLVETGQHPDQGNGNLVSTPHGQRLREGEKLFSKMKKEGDERMSPENIQAAAGNALGVMGPGLASSIPGLSKLGGLAGLLGRGAATVGEGALMGAAQSPNDRALGALVGGATQGAMTGAGKVLGKAGDVAMQMGVGRNKYTPGVGTELANQGLVGTRGMMKNQTTARLGEVGQEMGQVASEIPQVIDARKIGTEMGEELTSPLTGGGSIKPSSRDTGTVQQYQDFANDVASRGMETGEQALARRRAGGASAYSQKTMDPKLSPIAQSSKLEQQKYSQALKEADPRMAPLDESYAALAKSRHALSGEAPLTGSGVILGSAGKYGGALPLSVAGQAGVKSGKLAEFLSPIARQAASRGKGTPPPSAEELAEYDQYLKETGQK